MSTLQNVQHDDYQQSSPEVGIMMDSEPETPDLVLAAIDSAMSFYRENTSFLDELHSGQFQLGNMPVNFSAAKVKMMGVRDFMTTCPHTYEPMHLAVATKAAENGQYWTRHLERHKDAELFSPQLQTTFAKLQLEAEFTATQVALLKIERRIRILELTFNTEGKTPSQMATIHNLFRDLPVEWQRIADRPHPISQIGLYFNELYRQHAFVTKTEQAWKEYLDANFLDRITHGSNVLKDIVFDQLYAL